MKVDYSAYFRLFFLILCSAVFIFSFTRLGTSAYEKVFAKERIYSDNTSIGPVSVKGLSSGEAQAKLETEISNWLQNNQLFLSYGDKKIAVPSENINFLMEESVSAAERWCHESVTCRNRAKRSQFSVDSAYY